MTQFTNVLDTLKLSTAKRKKKLKRDTNVAKPHTPLNPDKYFGTSKNRKKHEAKVTEALQRAGPRMEAAALKKREKLKQDVQRLQDKLDAKKA